MGHRPQRVALLPDHGEHAADQGHLLGVHLVPCPGHIQAKPVLGVASGVDLALLCPALASPATTLAELGPLELGELVQDAIGEIGLGTIAGAIVEGAQLGAVVGELLAQQVEVGWLTGDAVPILRQHDRHAAVRNEIPHAIHARPLQARAALAWVRDLFQNFVAFPLHILPEPLHLLAEAETGAGLFVRGYAGVEDSPLWSVAVRGGHNLPPFF